MFLPNPTYLANPRVKKWVQTLLEHEAALAHAAGGSLGHVLGCGHWGCVIDMPGTPWALKVTVDPTEAHVWAKILSLVEDEQYGGDGFPRVKHIFQLEPGIPYGRQGRRHKAYGIVREKVAPVFNGTAFMSTYTLRRLGLPEDLQVFQGNIERLLSMDLPASTYAKVQEFVFTVEALRRYRSISFRVPRGRRPDSRTYQLLERTVYNMNGSIGGPVGESLLMLLSNEVMLLDVHLGNIGWRVQPEIQGYGYANECIVIFDPGHTPTAKRTLPKEQWQQLMTLG